MQKSQDFQFLIGNHLHNSLFAALANQEALDCEYIKIVKNTNHLYYPDNLDVDYVNDYNPKNKRVITTIDREIATAIADAVTLLDKEIGNKIAGVILHGSQSNGSANANSDIDIFVLLKESIPAEEQQQLRIKMNEEIDIHFSAVDSFWNSKSTMNYNILRKGLLLWVAG